MPRTIETVIACGAFLLIFGACHESKQDVTEATLAPASKGTSLTRAEAKRLLDAKFDKDIVPKGLIANDPVVARKPEFANIRTTPLTTFQITVNGIRNVSATEAVVDFRVTFTPDARACDVYFTGFAKLETRLAGLLPRHGTDFRGGFEYVDPVDGEKFWQVAWPDAPPKPISETEEYRKLTSRRDLVSSLLDPASKARQPMELRASLALYDDGWRVLNLENVPSDVSGR